MDKYGLNKINTNKKEKVEPMTLKAFVREQVEGGKELPFDLFGVYIANKTKITNKIMINQMLQTLIPKKKRKIRI